MSEPKGPFDDAIRILHEAKGEAILVDEELVEVQLDAAIRVLEDWPKWKPLIEAAGKVDKGRAIRTLATLLLVYTESEGRIIPALEKALKDGAVREIRALLEALPEEKK